MVDEEVAEGLVQFLFQNFRALSNYLAINDPDDSYIEAEITQPGRSTGWALRDIPGAEEFRTTEPPQGKHSDDSVGDPGAVAAEGEWTYDVRGTGTWRLRISDPAKPWSIEFSEASEVFRILTESDTRPVPATGSGPTTMKIFGVTAFTHDEATQRLEDIAGSVLFDIELRYGVARELARYSPRRPRRKNEIQRMQQPPSLPRFRYPAEALSLYNYGRSAAGMPLLQHLAFYHVLEFFFPQHFRRSQLLRIRQAIMDPTFNVTDDGHLARILSISSQGNRGPASEREQLKATINGCTDEATLREFLEENEARLGILTDKRKIKNVHVLDLGQRAVPLQDQVANRIYELRCRIVHTKGDGGDTTSNFLLPGSREAESLSADVELIRFLAQKAIIASGSPIL